MIKYEFELSNDEKKSCKYDLNKVYAVSQVLTVNQLLSIFSNALESNIEFDPLTERQFDCMPFLNNETKKALKWYANPGKTIGWDKANKINDELKNDIPKAEYLFNLVYNDDNIKLQTCEVWANNNKEIIESGGELASVFVWFKRYAKIKAFIAQHVVAGSIFNCNCWCCYFVFFK